MVWEGDHSFGSPPLTRGPRASLPSTISSTRITPAYAGTTSTPSRARTASPDHPRLRGDHSIVFIERCARHGSPPLTRGPLDSDGLVPQNLRITPAYAGTTAPRDEVTTVIPDHPRLRGDHNQYRTSNTRPTGSPPLTRGPPFYPTVGNSFYRITPAYAGTTRWPPSPPRWSSDHPRLRGDHIGRGSANSVKEDHPRLRGDHISIVE